MILIDRMIPNLGMLTSLLLLGFAGPGHAGPLVVRAAGPSAAQFRQGQRLGDAPLVLKMGDSIVVLDAKGTRSFSGPGVFRLQDPSAEARQVSFAELLMQKPARRARIGAVRAAGQESGPSTPPGVWTLDIRTSGTVCVVDPANIALWRADTSAAQALKVTRADGVSAKLIFAAGQATAVLPAVLSGKPAAFTITGADAPVTLTVKQVTAAADIETLAVRFIDGGCQSQFARLAANASQH